MVALVRPAAATVARGRGDRLRLDVDTMDMTAGVDELGKQCRHRARTAPDIRHNRARTYSREIPEVHFAGAGPLGHLQIAVELVGSELECIFGHALATASWSRRS